MNKDDKLWNQKREIFISAWIEDKGKDFNDDVLTSEYFGSAEVMEYHPDLSFAFKWKGKNYPYVWYALALEQLYHNRFPIVKSVKARFKAWSFVTLAPSKAKRGLIKNKLDLTNWCELWFNEKHYEKCIWVCESGKSEDSPFYHLHYLCQGVKRSLKKKGIFPRCKNLGINI